MGNSCFADTGLTSITIPDTVTTMYDPSWPFNGTFYGCTNLQSVTIGSGITSLGAYTFQSCTSLTSFTIPDTVTSIGDACFIDCTSLTTLQFNNQNTLTTASEYLVFEGCPAFSLVTYYSTQEGKLTSASQTLQKQMIANGTSNFIYNPNSFN